MILAKEFLKLDDENNNEFFEQIYEKIKLN